MKVQHHAQHQTQKNSPHTTTLPPDEQFSFCFFFRLFNYYKPIKRLYWKKKPARAAVFLIFEINLINFTPKKNLCVKNKQKGIHLFLGIFPFGKK
jgi:hypothetical protein